jgi:hypothetical protein
MALVCFAFFVLAIVSGTLSKDRRIWLSQRWAQRVSSESCQFITEFSKVLWSVDKDIMILGPPPKEQAIPVKLDCLKHNRKGLARLGKPLFP